jgi:hypothetical protein
MGDDIIKEIARKPRWKDSLNASRERLAVRLAVKGGAIGSLPRKGRLLSTFCLRHICDCISFAPDYDSD